MMNASSTRGLEDSWSSKQGFWYRHPLLAWTLQLAVAIPVYLFAAPYVLGTRDERAALALVSFWIFRGLTKLKARERSKRLLRPSPWFFWFC
jgi:hypothetical protein